ncbi:hypothetical protein [Flavihumibacter sp. CACIAM 22H1]|uniref:hypothetical protein n=1 Tax=Flavihumibacter sp. CACIAM 22H1 TaxID=1812911 RepID=UPI0007A8DF5A|nr:hypothetical protein [Flavihumibacter sp. CACIAM 22H1]KYP14273.1 MAG: hypothetical protein A1D16_17655 [Flavihumibacter sp. CACIAM 22H1]
MKTFIKTSVLLFWLASIAVLLLTACKKDDSGNSGLVELLSFGPSGVQHGEEIKFIGNNLQKVNSIQFVGATVEKAGFKSQSNELIVLVLPDAVEAGLVKLITTDGEIVSRSPLNLEIPLQVTSFTPVVKPGANLTIQGKFLNWVTELRFNKDIVVTEFVSKSVDELVVTVPMEAQSGPLVLSAGGTEPISVETETSLDVVLPAVVSFDPSPAEREKEFTITGTDLDLVKGVLFKGLTTPITNFISQSETAIKLMIPAEANRGLISLVAFSDVVVESEEPVLFVGDLPPLPALSYAFYVDALMNNWQNWGWNTTIDYANKDNIRDGDAAMKVNYTGHWGALKFANNSVSLAGYNEITFSIFGTAGTNGKRINVKANDGVAYTITIEEGKWVEYKLTKADLGNPATINDLVFQNFDWTGTIYFDHAGLR